MPTQFISIEERVLDFVSEVLGRDRATLSTKTQLVRHLHLQGDQVGAFLETFRDCFQVDLDRLVLYWSWHFPGKYCPDWVQPVIGICALGGCILHDLIGKGNLWIWCLAAIAVWYVGYRFWWPYRDPAPLPISLEDLVEAARYHAWVKVYPERS